MSTELERLVAQKLAKEFVMEHRQTREEWQDAMLTHDELMHLMDKALKYDAARNRIKDILEKESK